ncbi:electron transfer protein 1, mitochondrial precursor [Saccharata proteae CBS 121410]|uniref:Electron transfer protein 1, mitochondrial n=1 Tax=Saccharata proteae CBS 121410 TaxID=1314787 RepID=A0A9P4I5N0_9PEZI|nr:electron transfer protein 1, mitochondrial precursor [Saccharata proteae CBS 121410]
MASLFQAFPALRRAVPHLSRHLFTCRSCLSDTSAPAATRAFFHASRPQPLARAVKWQSAQVFGIRAQSSVASAADAVGTRAMPAVKPRKYFPRVSDKIVAYWLLGSAASVFGIVVFGGLTRLTESGLSITEWRPVAGSLPPMNQEDWDSEFDKYRSSPEFQLLNSRMTLEEFKKIYFMEWAHRVWGRVIGVTFLLPTIYFITRRKVTKPMAWKLVGICGMIGFQGLIGWWMVASGLKDDLFAPGSHPRVSQYRLTAHLGAAFIVYSSMLLSGLSILRDRRWLADPLEASKVIDKLQAPQLRPFRRYVTALTGLIFITAMSGALVAGLDAGLIYNEFPWMGLGLTPPKKELFDPWYSHTPDKRDLWWRNMLENPSLVQLDHRVLATTTFTAIMALFAWSRFSPAVRRALPKNAKTGVMGVFHMAWVQVTLGISTLIYMVPTHLAATHQAGSLMLLSLSLLLWSRLRAPSRLAAVKPAARPRPVSSVVEPKNS